MKIILYSFLIVPALLTGIHQSSAQEARYFRISGPAATTIIAFQPDGSLVWSNALPGTNYVVQTVAAMPSGTDWVNYIKLPVTQSVNTNQIIAFNPPTGMVLIPAGSFTMGDNLGDGTNEGLYDEIPLHTVYVSAFYMDQYDVTEALWEQVYNWATNHGYSFDDPGSVYDGFTRGPNYPVVDVNWYDVVKWCNARSEMAGLTPAYYTDGSQTTAYRTGDIDISSACVNWNGGGYRLPTEVEWEKAARGGLSGQRFPWGNTINESQANYDAWPLSLNSGGCSYDVNTYTGLNTNFDTGNSPCTSPVRYFAPNGYGLYDMAGNVWQWCWDWYSSSYYSSSPSSDPRGPATTSGDRVLRGGSWDIVADYTRCAYRNGYGYPVVDSDLNGFRCVRGL